MTTTSEAMDSVSRALIDAHAVALAAIRARVVELERTVAGLRRELARLGLPEITEAWE